MCLSTLACHEPCTLHLAATQIFRLPTSTLWSQLLNYSFLNCFKAFSTRRASLVAGASLFLEAANSTSSSMFEVTAADQKSKRVDRERATQTQVRIEWCAH